MPESLGYTFTSMPRCGDSNNVVQEKEIQSEDFEKLLQDVENNPEFQSAMEGMNQIISKDILYEPMKELREKARLLS